MMGGRVVWCCGLGTWTAYSPATFARITALSNIPRAPRYDQTNQNRASWRASARCTSAPSRRSHPCARSGACLRLSRCLSCCCE